MTQPIARPSLAAVSLVLLIGFSVGCGDSRSGAATASASADPKAGKSAFERFADAVCACTNEKCVSAAFSAFENANARRPKNAPLSPADEEAMQRGEKCIEKIVPAK